MGNLLAVNGKHCKNDANATGKNGRKACASRQESILQKGKPVNNYTG